jgi:hypothetical protein
VLFGAKFSQNLEAGVGMEPLLDQEKMLWNHLSHLKSLIHLVLLGLQYLVQDPDAENSF